jgi:Spy/CpxP family protein refolding chaperone
MRISTFTLGAAVAALFAVNALAADQSASSGNDPNEVICKRENSETGSRLGARNVCLTRKQWDERRRNDQDMTTRSQSQSLTTRPPGG